MGGTVFGLDCFYFDYMWGRNFVTLDIWRAVAYSSNGSFAKFIENEACFNQLQALFLFGDGLIRF